MSEQKHTPGPWRLEQDTTLVWGSCNPDDTSDRGMGYPIAECRITPISYLWAKGPEAYEGEANARLIVAAPDMLEALKKLDGHLSILMGNIHGSVKVDPRWEGMEHVVRGWREDIKAVTEKAEGRS